MTLRDLLEQLKQFPPDALVCATEVNEAFAANIASLELVENASIGTRDADGTEAVELGGGQDKVVVIRW